MVEAAAETIHAENQGAADVTTMMIVVHAAAADAHVTTVTDADGSEILKDMPKQQKEAGETDNEKIKMLKKEKDKIILLFVFI